MGHAEDTKPHGRSANQYGATYAIRGPSRPYEAADQPPSNQHFASSSNQPRHAGIKKRVQQIQVKGRGEIAGQPGEQQINGVRLRAKPQGYSDHFRLAYQVAEGCGLRGQKRRSGGLFFGGIWRCYVIPFTGGERRVVRGITIDAGEQEKVEKADQAGCGKTPSPTDLKKQNPNERHADGRGKFGCAIEDRRSQTPFPGRKPVADRLCIGREGGSFSYTQEQTCGEEAAQIRGNGGGKGSNAPYKSADPPHPAHPEFVQQDANGKLA